jgi:hypothetical protein
LRIAEVKVCHHLTRGKRARNTREAVNETNIAAQNAQHLNLSLEANSKPDGHSKIDELKDGTYSYAYMDPQQRKAGLFRHVDPQRADLYSYAYADHPRGMKLPSVQIHGVDGEKRKESENEENGDKFGYTNANVSKDADCHIELSEGQQDDSKDNGDGYLEMRSSENPVTEANAKETNEGESSNLNYPLSSRMEAVTPTKQKTSGREKFQTNAKRQDETKPRVPLTELTNPTFQGILHRRKQDMGPADWEAGRWYILHNHMLYYCSPNDKKYATKDFKVLTYTVKPCKMKHHEYAFELSLQGSSSVVFRAKNCEQRDKWIEALNKAEPNKYPKRPATAPKPLKLPRNQSKGTHLSSEKPEPTKYPEIPVAASKPLKHSRKLSSEKPGPNKYPESRVITPKPLKSPRKQVEDGSVSREKTCKSVNVDVYDDVFDDAYEDMEAPAPQSVFHAAKSHRATVDNVLSFEVGDLVLMDNMEDETWWVGTLKE